MRKASLALGLLGALALAAATPSFAAISHHTPDQAKPTDAHSADGQVHRSKAPGSAQAQQASTCWIRGEMGENPNGNFGHWGSCSEPGARPGRY